jgi:hypothetical protein
VVAVIEHHDRLAAGGVPGDLHRVLDRFGAGVEQRRPLLESPGSQLVELLADGYVGLVRRDHEAGVGEPLDLGVYRVHHQGCAVADAGDGDARGEVDPLAAVDVGERATRCMVHIG